VLISVILNRSDRSRSSRLVGRASVRHADRGIDAAGVADRSMPTTEFAARYGAVEMPTPDGPPAPNRAVASLWFGDATAPGARTTLGARDKLNRSCLRVVSGATLDPRTLPHGSASNGAGGRVVRSSRPVRRNRLINGGVALDYLRRCVGVVGRMARS
jgi:hypothetical protein